MILGLKDFSLNLEGLRKISYKVNSKIKPEKLREGLKISIISDSRNE